ncbi:MAG TPA: hypothetical protein PLV92_03535 [Pirellulaceae bacterium]|nr:hypothetical protein [Pirellulaceae bacterium]
MLQGTLQEGSLLQDRAMQEGSLLQGSSLLQAGLRKQVRCRADLRGLV